MSRLRLIWAYTLVATFAVGAIVGLMVYFAFLEQTKSIQLRNIDETLELLKQDLKSFDIVALENISQVLYGADYVTGLKVVTASGFVVFDEKKDKRGVASTYEFIEPRESGEARRLGTVTIEVNHDSNAARNIALSGLTGGLLSFLLVRLIFSARSLKRELSVRKASEAALREQEENLRTLLNSLTEAVISSNSLGRVMQMNPVAERLTGWTFAEARGRPIDEIFHIIDSKTRARIGGQGGQGGPAFVPTRSPGREESVTLVGREGAEHPVAPSVAPLIGADARISGVVIVFRDVTAELQTQQRLREMEKMQAIGVLAGGIAHDFNNLLGVISSAAEVIAFKDKARLSPSSGKLLETIVKTTRRGADLTSRLLAVGHEPRVEQTTFSLHASIDNVVTLLKRTIDKRFDVEVMLRARNDNVFGNASLMENALLNIGLNASQAMKDDRGAFLIATENVDLGPDDEAVRIHHAPTGPCVKITLRDNGVGVPFENINRIFEPFFTNRRGGGGFGLGLWAVYNTVRDHGGTIYAESQLGVETRFLIYLPISAEAPEALDAGEQIATPTNRTLLIVDDEDDIRATLAAMLTSLGCQARAVSGGDEAVGVFRREHGSIDAAIVDLNMPGMSGEDTIVELRRIDPNLPIVISSGYPASSQIAAQPRSNDYLFLKKPYFLVDLAATLSKLFGEEPA